MVERYAIKTNTTYNEFLYRNREVKFLSFEEEEGKRNGRLWIEDKFGNFVLFITDIQDNVIIEVRCYAPYDPSFALYLLVKRERSQIVLRDNNICWRNPANYKDIEYKNSTAKFLQQVKKNKNYKMYSSKISE
jgi:hypothetical protein